MVFHEPPYLSPKAVETEQRHELLLKPRLLYHPLIEPGMNQDQVIAVFPEVYRQTIETPVYH